MNITFQSLKKNIDEFIKEISKKVIALSDNLFAIDKYDVVADIVGKVGIKKLIQEGLNSKLFTEKNTQGYKIIIKQAITQYKNECEENIWEQSPKEFLKILKEKMICKYIKDKLVDNKQVKILAKYLIFNTDDFPVVFYSKLQKRIKQKIFKIHKN